MKSSSGHILINNINQNKDMKDNNNAIQISTRKSSNNIRMNLNNPNKLSNRIFLKKHIVIESNNINIVNDTRKNNNSYNSSNNNKYNVEGNSGNNNYNDINNKNNRNSINFENNIKFQIKDKINEFKDYNQISNYQNNFNGAKYKSKN